MIRPRQTTIAIAIATATTIAAFTLGGVASPAARAGDDDAAPNDEPAKTDEPDERDAGGDRASTEELVRRALEALARQEKDEEDDGDLDEARRLVEEALKALQRTTEKLDRDAATVERGAARAALLRATDRTPVQGVAGVLLGDTAALATDRYVAALADYDRTLRLPSAAQWALSTQTDCSSCHVATAPPSDRASECPSMRQSTVWSLVTTPGQGAETLPADDGFDHVLLESGDDIRGRVGVLTDGKLGVTHDDLGDLSVPWTKVTRVTLAQAKSDADAPAAATPAPHRVRLHDGSLLRGTIVSASREIVVLATAFADRLEIPMTSVDALSFADQDIGTRSDGEDRLYFQRDDRLSGRFLGIDDGKVRFESPWNRGGAVAIPLDGLCSVAFPRSSDTASSKGTRPATLRLVLRDGSPLRGSLVGLDADRVHLLLSWGAKASVKRTSIRAIRRGDADDASATGPAAMVGAHSRAYVDLTRAVDLDVRPSYSLAFSLNDGTTTTATTGRIEQLRRDGVDVVTLRNGDRASGDVVRLDEHEVVIRAPFGTIVADRREVTAVVFRAPPRPYLGVQGSDAPGGTGARLDKVLPETAAADAGLIAGDVVTRFDGSAVAGWDDLANAIRGRRAGQRALVFIVRDGEERTLEVTLGERQK